MNTTKFKKFVKSEKFIKFQKELAESLYLEIAKNYNIKEERDLIKDSINPSINSREGDITIESEYIGDKKSQVSFAGCTTSSREVGDILLSIMLVDSNSLVFHKISIVQVKKGLLHKWKPNQSGKEQLYLLSKFPKFEGVSGIFQKGKNFILQNHSKCLGSYFFINPNVGIEFSSAYLLDIFINNLCCLCSYANSINIKNIYFRNILFCPNSFDFIENFTKFNIGEVLFSEIPYITINKELREIFIFILRKIQEKDLKFLPFCINAYRLNINSNIPESGKNKDNSGILLINLLINISEFRE